MFCPEDGTELKPVQDTGGKVYYPECPHCETYWVYDAVNGGYKGWGEQTAPYTQVGEELEGEPR